MNRNIERGQATRTQLIEVATGLFAVRGYEGTSIEAVLAEPRLVPDSASTASIDVPS